MDDDEARERLTARLALPEHEPDPLFVVRVKMAIRAEIVIAAAAKARREQLITEAMAAIAMFLCARQLITIADETAVLLAPLATWTGALALAVGAALMLLTAGASNRPSHSKLA